MLPAPVQDPHPPIWIGGTGEKRTLRLVARYADAWNGLGPIAMLQQRIEVLKQHCNDAGRRFEDITLTAGAAMIPDAIYDRYIERNSERQGLPPEELRQRTIGGAAEDMKAAVQAYADAGFEHVVLMVNTPYDAGLFERFAKEVIPAFR